MDALSKKTLKTSRGYTYTYYTSPGSTSLPTLFFQHGWPDQASLWASVATRLQSTNHPVIIPDLLGYDGTSKPTDPSAYKWSVMLPDLIEILDTEGAERFISIGHDWGSACASRMYNYYPDRCAGLVNICIAYVPPSRTPFDLDAVNQMTEQAFGYPFYGYWYLFTSDDGPAILKDNIERLYHALHGSGESMKETVCVTNALRNYLTNGGPDITLQPYAQKPEFKQAWIERLTRDGFEAPLCWYRAAVSNLMSECDKNLPEGVEKVEVPALYIHAKDDPVGRPETMYGSIQAGLLPQLEQAETIEASHWVMREKPEEVVDRLEKWLGKHYKK